MVLTKEEEGHQLPVYYVIKALLVAKTYYLDIKKLTLSLVTVSINFHKVKAVLSCAYHISTH